MNNTTAVVIYAPFAFITIATLVINLFRRFNRQDHYFFMRLNLCLFLWFVSRLAGILANSAELAKFFISFSIAFIGFMAPFLLLSIIAFYHVTLKKPHIITLLLFIIPMANAAVALTARHHSLMFTQLEIISLSPIREVVLEWGPWFWVHAMYSYVLSLVTIAIIFVLHFRTPKFYRMPSTMIIVSLLITLAGNVVVLLKLLPLTMDPTLIAMSLSFVFFELAIYSNSNSKFVRFSRGQVFQYIKEYILISDENQRIVDYNNLAFEWFAERKINVASSLFKNVMEELFSSEKVVKKDFGNETDIYLNDGIFPVTLNLRVQEITDVRGDKIGSIAIFTDVTQNRLLIERLEAQAGMDSLTSLANRMAYEGAKKRFDNPEFFPLSVVMCDANGLKHVNDTLGHKYGDMMLQTIADILAKSCPKQCFLARLGGDEFIFLLPRTSPEGASALMEEIRYALANYKNAAFGLSAALGAATKFSVEDDLEQIIALADNYMYEDKKLQKESNGQPA